MPDLFRFWAVSSWSGQPFFHDRNIIAFISLWKRKWNPNRIPDGGQILKKNGFQRLILKTPENVFEKSDLSMVFVTSPKSKTKHFAWEGCNFLNSLALETLSFSEPSKAV